MTRSVNMSQQRQKKKKPSQIYFVRESTVSCSAGLKVHLQIKGARRKPNDFFLFLLCRLIFPSPATV